MSTEKVAYIIYGVITLCVFVYGIQEILLEKGKDDFGTPMRHRWDVPLMMAAFWPMWVAFVWPYNAIDWCWKKIVKP
jgi:hypothetical protein